MRTPIRSHVILTTALTLGAIAQAAAAVVPTGFTDRNVGAVPNPTAMEVVGDGRLFVADKGGRIRVVKNDQVLATPAVDFSDHVDTTYERGFDGITIDPAFASNHSVYVYYTTTNPVHNRLSRFTMAGDVVSGGETILFELDSGLNNPFHNGGALHFGPDGKLYVAVGNDGNGGKEQRLDSLEGKILRLNADGSIPGDNPFAGQTSGKNRAIWAMGLRHPFTTAFQPGTGRFFINDVGENTWEEVNDGVAGANYGFQDGATDGVRHVAGFRDPIFTYHHDSGVKSITGGAFYNPARAQFPSSYVGKYLFADWGAGWIRVLDPQALPGDPTDGSRVPVFASGIQGPVDVRVAADGSLYYLSRGPTNSEPDSTGAFVGKITYAPAPPAVSSVTRFVLVDADTDRDVGVFANGQIVDPSAIGTTHLTVRAETSPATVASVRFDLDGAVNVHTESAAPYAFASDNAGDYNPWTLAAGQHTITATPTLGGAVGQGGSVTFVLLSTATSSPPAHLAFPANGGGALPAVLSATGVFANLGNLTPGADLLGYTVNVTFWSDGAKKTRYVAVPAGQKVGFNATGEWTFPQGTVFVKHFDFPVDDRNAAITRRLETRVLVRDDRGAVYGLTYKWDAAQTQATLLDGSVAEDLAITTTSGGTRHQTWYYPGRGDCLACHNANAGYVLGVKTRQMNCAFTYPGGTTANQIAAWSQRGLFANPPAAAAIPGLSKVVPLSDEGASLEVRARSYLDTNCSYCHRPNGPTPATFDARFDTPLANQGLVNGAVGKDLGIAGAKVIVPGDTGRSILYQRVHSVDGMIRMPPIGRLTIDTAGADLLARWIGGLGAGGGGGNLLAEYYSGTMELAGSPAATAQVANIDVDWGGGSPAANVSTDGFSVRWTGDLIAPAGGVWTFYATTDNGRRLWIDGQPVIDRWLDDWDVTYTGTVTLAAGTHDFRMEYFDHVGGANAHLEWSGPGTARQIIPAQNFGRAGGGLTGTFYANQTLSGAPAATRIDQTIDFDWGLGAIDPHVPIDHTSARWTGLIVPRFGETYTFTTLNDDGVRLWIDGRLIIDDWNGHDPKTNTGQIALQAGQAYDIRIEYFEVDNTAVLHLWWNSASQAKEIVPTSRLVPAPIGIGMRAASGDAGGAVLVDAVGGSRERSLSISASAMRWR